MLLEDIIAYVKKKNLGLIQGNMIKSFLIYNNDKNWALKLKKKHSSYNNTQKCAIQVMKCLQYLYTENYKTLMNFLKNLNI